MSAGADGDVEDAGRPPASSRWLLAVVVACTGASALALQVVWQRVISMHSGVDLASSTTVVAGFLAGLGIGSLWGGRIADRLGPRRSLVVFACANVGVAAFAWFSVDLFYDLYRELAPSLRSRPAGVAFHVVALLVPTTLQGLSLPLLARVVTRRDGESGELVGRLYGINTLGAAFGSMWAGWFLMGRFGFEAAARAAGTLNLVAAALVAVHVAVVRDPGVPRSDRAARAARATGSGGSHGSTGASVAAVDVPWRWYVLYAATGAVALGFQQVFFRFVDSIMRSNSYSFSLVLAMYLGCWGLGAAIGARLVRRVVDVRGWFVGLQVGSALVAGLALLVVVRVLPAIGFGGAFDRWFSSDGFAGGFAEDAGMDLVWFGLALPALVIAGPIVLLGASYPFVQAIVAPRSGDVGRRTGALGAANVLGNVAGTVVTGFVLIDVLGTAGTYRLLVALLGVAAVVAAVASAKASRARRLATAGVVVVALVVVAMPSNATLWRFVVGGDALDVETVVAEDRSCASVLRVGDSRQLVINGAPQNDSPFDDFHVLIGLVPMLVHPDPDRALAVGFGIGSTTYAMLADPRAARVTTVELCGGNYELAHELADRGVPEFSAILGDPRSELLEGDGRRHLLVSDDRYDALVVDTLRHTSANAGSHFSLDFFRLAGSRLAEGGLMAEWVPTTRTHNSVAAAFPHVVTGTVDNYTGSVFFLGSRQPITIDRDRMLARFDAIAVDLFEPDQRERLRRFLEEWVPRCVTAGRTVTGWSSDDVNRDLFPRDEYSLDNRLLPASRELSTC